MEQFWSYEECDDFILPEQHIEKETQRCDSLLWAVEGISLTSDEEQPDCITYMCDEDIRAIMPCGHVIGPQSLFDYCTDQLKRGDSELTCASCSAVWDYGLVRHVACLSAAEGREFERRMSENALQRMSGLQMCASCDSWCCRDDPNNDMVHCVVCSMDTGHAYYFCWKCLHAWNDGADGKCGNAACSGKEETVLEQLENCPLKNIGSAVISCPSVRACPHCYTLIEHQINCSHIKCKVCGHEFCFVCLKPFADATTQLTVQPEQFWNAANQRRLGYHQQHQQQQQQQLGGNAKCAAVRGCSGAAPRQTSIGAPARPSAANTTGEELPEGGRQWQRREFAAQHAVLDDFW